MPVGPTQPNCKTTLGAPGEMPKPTQDAAPQDAPLLLQQGDAFEPVAAGDEAVPRVKIVWVTPSGLDELEEPLVIRLLREEDFPDASAFVLSPDAARFATRDMDFRTLRIHDVASGQILWKRNFRDRIAPPHFSPDGTTLAVKSHDRQTLRLVDAASVKTRWKKTWPFACHPPVFSPEGSKIAVIGDDDSTLWVTDTLSGKKQWSKPLTRDSVNSFSPDGQCIAIHDSKTLRLYNTTTGEAQWEHASDERIDRHYFSPDGKTVLMVTWSGPNFNLPPTVNANYSYGPDAVATVHGLDAASGRQQWERTCGQSILTPAFSADSKTLVIAGGTTLRLLDSESGRLIYSKIFDERLGLPLVFSLNGQHLIASSIDGKNLHVLAAESGDALRVQTFNARIPNPVFLPDEKHFAVKDGKIVRIFDIASGEQIWSKTFKGPIRNPKFSAGGTQMAIISEEEMFLFSVERRQLRTRSGWRIEPEPSPGSVSVGDFIL